MEFKDFIIDNYEELKDWILKTYQFMGYDAVYMAGDDLIQQVEDTFKEKRFYGEECDIDEVGVVDWCRRTFMGLPEVIVLDHPVDVSYDMTEWYGDLEGLTYEDYIGFLAENLIDVIYHDTVQFRHLAEAMRP